MLLFTISAALGAGLLSWILTPWIIKLAFKVKAVDIPDARKVHTQAMPSMGGLAVFLGFSVVVLISQPVTNEIKGLLLGGTAIVIIGIIDDIKDINAWLKFIGQIFAALIAVGFGIEVSYITNPLADNVINLGVLSIPLTVFWIVMVTNAFNLIDGLDGLAGGVAAIASVTLAAVSWSSGRVLEAGCALILAGAAIGFLKYNFYPAKIFLGDTGSMFLGYILGVLSIMGLTKGVTLVSLIIPIIILGIPLLDTVFAVIRRLMKHKSVFSADKGHLHHRLLAMGLSHAQVVIVIYFADITFSLIAIISTMITTKQTFFILLFLVVLILIIAQKIGITGKSQKQKETEKEFPSRSYEQDDRHNM